MSPHQLPPAHCTQIPMDAVSSTQLLRFFKPHFPIYPFQRECPRNHPICPRVTSKTRELVSAHKVFDEIPQWDTFTWNSIIHAQLSSGDPDGALAVFCQMVLRGVHPDSRTFPRVLTASCLTRNLDFGVQLHCQVIKLGLCYDPYIVSGLVEMYGRLDSVDLAGQVFEKSPVRNLVCWTVLARLYVMENRPNLAIEMFYQMVEDNIRIDPVALATAIGACGMLKSLEKGRNLHEVARKCGLEFDVLVGNALLKMYVDCHSVEDVREIFDRMPMKDVVSWTEVIRGYVKKGAFNEALKLFRKMNMDGIRLDAFTITSILPACARITAHKNGKEIHGYLLRNGMNDNLMVQNATMDMYVKSGFIDYASKVFERMKIRDAISFTVMILGFSLHGKGELGVELFRGMETDPNVGIDQSTYEAVLCSCTAACLVEEGKYYFSCIKEPKVSHFALMVSLLCRAALFDEAKAFIEEHHIRKHVEVLRVLLDGCRIHQQRKLGKSVVQQLCKLEPCNAENYVLLSNWYAHGAKWDMVDEVIGDIREMDLKTRKAYSWIEFRNKVHVFGTEDVSHPKARKIYRELQSLIEKIEAQGQRLSSDYGFHDVDEERECVQIGHSEMLALSFGLISAQAGTTIRISKNLRVCPGCHDFAKIISKLVHREIIIKDPNCFHHFKDGLCSCRDLW